MTARASKGTSTRAACAALVVAVAAAAAACGSRGAGADDDAGGARAAAGRASGAFGARTVRIDRSLVESGRVTLAAAEQRAPARELRVSGEARSNESGSAEAGALVPGRVATLEVAEGAKVRRGQVLAWIDAPEAARASADVLRARARAAVAARKLGRQLELEAQRATSKNAVDEARAEDETSRADLLAARTLLASVGGREPPAAPPDGELGTLAVRVPIRAPLAGTVARRDAVLGAAVTPDKALFRIVASDEVTVAARVPETATRPAEGSRATLTARGDAAQKCEASVAGSLGIVDDASRTVTVTVRPAGPCAWLVPGGYVDVTFAAAADGGAAGPPEIVVPKEAVVDVHGVACVFVAGATPEEVVVRSVRVRATGGPDVVVESGVAAGERVAVTGVALLKGELLRAEIEGS